MEVKPRLELDTMRAIQIANPQTRRFENYMHRVVQSVRTRKAPLELGADSHLDAFSSIRDAEHQSIGQLSNDVHHLGPRASQQSAVTADHSGQHVMKTGSEKLAIGYGDYDRPDSIGGPMTPGQLIRR